MESSRTKVGTHQVLFCHIMFHIGQSKGKVCLAVENTVHKSKEFRTCDFSNSTLTSDRLPN